jgi:hypothetical protein
MKISVALLAFALTAAVLNGTPAGARQAAADQSTMKPAAKETKWQGHIVRINKDNSMIDIHGGAAPSDVARKVAYDSSTEWTKLGKPSKQDEVTNDAFIIILGNVDDKGVMHATRIDLRNPR